MANGNGGIMEQIGQGLLQAQQSPAFNVGMGLLSAAGPSQQPMSTGQRLASGFQTGMGLQQRAMENQFQRRQMQQRARQQEASEQLTNLLQTDLPPANIRRPGAAQDQQQEMMSLLSQANPEAFQTGLLQQMMGQQERAEPSELRMIRALRDPSLDQDQRELLRRNIAGAGASDQLMQRLDLLVRQAELERMQREDEQAEQEQRQNQAELQGSFRQDLSDARKLAELNNRLRDTALETGMPMPELRRQAAAASEAGRNIIGAVTGQDLSDEKSQQVIADFDEFNKLASRFAGSTANRLFSEGGLTNQQLRQAQQQTPSASMSPIANNRIIADQIDTLLSGAQNAGVNLTEDEIAETRSFIEDLRTQEQSGQGQGQDGGGGSGSPGPGALDQLLDGGGGGAASVQPAGPAPSLQQPAEQGETPAVLGIAEQAQDQRRTQENQALEYIRGASESELVDLADRAGEMPPRLRRALDQRLTDLGF